MKIKKSFVIELSKEDIEVAIKDYIIACSQHGKGIGCLIDDSNNISISFSVVEGNGLNGSDSVSAFVKVED